MDDVLLYQLNNYIIINILIYYIFEWDSHKKDTLMFVNYMYIIIVLNVYNIYIYIYISIISGMCHIIAEEEEEILQINEDLNIQKGHFTSDLLSKWILFIDQTHK